MPERYFHRQHGPLCLILYACGFLMLGVVPFVNGVPVASVTIPVAAALMLIGAPAFHYLEVRDGGNHLAVQFGPLRLFRLRIPYDDMQQVDQARSTWLDGWGIHLSLRGGWLWNLWGRDCVVIQRRTGKISIGTDEPEQLAEFLRGQIR